MWRAVVAGIIFGTSLSAQAGQLDWIKQTQFFAYTPSGFHFKQDRPVFADRHNIEQDLRVLRHYSNGLILYSTDQSTADILAIAHELKFDTIILGLWSITDRTELNRAVELTRHYPNLVRAIVVGNEGLFWKRYTKTEHAQAINIIRKSLPDIALTTTEPFASYLGTPATIDCANQDFLLPNIHPVFEHWFNQNRISQSVEFVDNIVTRLISLCHKQVLIKETGIPSGPGVQSYSEQRQLAFWQELFSKVKTKPMASLVFFEAFDAPWKVDEIQKQSGKRDERERYWGWFTHERKPKAVVGLLNALHEQ